VEAGDQLHFITWGGGGWGDPLEREPETVAREVREGLITEQGARRYGVVVASGQVDIPATEALRTRLRSGHRASNEIFNYGPPLDELRARCEVETGLPAPRQPVWRQAREAA
jgi:N-methylhydantoinase B